MRRAIAAIVVGGAVAAAAAFALNQAQAAPLGRFHALRGAADQASLVLPARIICQITNDYLAGWCEENCKNRSKKQWFETIYGAVCRPEFGWPACPPGSTSLVASDGKHSCCPQERMRTITSCTPVPSPNGADLCRIQLCGPADDIRERARRVRNLDTSRYTTPGPRVGPPQPGLLEGGGGGLGTQGPAATGTPTQTAPTFQRGGGSGLR